MGVIRDKWVNIDNFYDIGDFYAHHSDRNTSSLPLKPVFKVVEINSDPLEKNHKLEPGFINVDGKFYRCPLVSHYVQINYIREKLIYEPYVGPVKKKVNLKILIFSKSYDSYRNEDIEMVSSNTALDFMCCNHIVNIINKYINSDRSIDKLNIDLFDVNKPKKKSLSYVRKTINSLKFNTFKNSRQRAGRDQDHIWTEVEIKNLPKDRYMVNAIKQVLESNIAYSLKEESYGLFMKLPIRKGVPESYRRKKIHGKTSIDMIKDTLKMNLAKIFNPEQHLFENIARE